MNRFRRLSGPNSYCSELGIDIAAALPAGGRWLDVGCGTGFAVRELAVLRPDVTVVAVDPEPGFENGEQPPPNLSFVRSTIEALDLDRRFSLVTAVHVLHFVADKQAALAKLAGGLDGEGRLYAHIDPLDVWLGERWENASPLGGAPFTAVAAERWGKFIGSRWAAQGNRQGVRSLQSLYQTS